MVFQSIVHGGTVLRKDFKERIVNAGVPLEIPITLSKSVTSKVRTAFSDIE